MSSELTQREVRLISAAGGFSGADIAATIYLPPFNIDRRDFNDREAVSDRGIAYQLGSIQTLTYSVYTSKEAVRALGFRSPISHPRGHRTIAGTLIFNQLHTHPFDDTGIRTVIDPSNGGMLSYSSGDVSYVRSNETKTIADILNATEENRVDINPGAILYETAIRKRHMFDFTWDQRTTGRTLHPGDMPKFDIVCVFVNELGNIGKLVIYGVDLIHEASVLSIEDIYTEVTYQYVAQDIEYFKATSLEQARAWISETLRLSSRAPDPEGQRRDTIQRFTAASSDKAAAKQEQAIGSAIGRIDRRIEQARGHGQIADRGRDAHFRWMSETMGSRR